MEEETPPTTGQVFRAGMGTPLLPGGQQLCRGHPHNHTPSGGAYTAFWSDHRAAARLRFSNPVKGLLGVRSSWREGVACMWRAPVRSPPRLASDGEDPAHPWDRLLASWDQEQLAEGAEAVDPFLEDRIEIRGLMGLDPGTRNEPMLFCRDKGVTLRPEPGLRAGQCVGKRVKALGAPFYLHW